MEQRFVRGSVQSPIGPIPRVSTVLSVEDRLGTLKVRWGFGRRSYKVDPGLYAAGHPSEQSPVLVTANYKLSFDRLRSTLTGLNAWILVLDTDGVNVWCAAGKGSFGTEELVNRIASSGLQRLVSHRELIVPQLGAPGIAAHLVRKLSGFKVIYGPVFAADLPAFLRAGMKATPQMRFKSFGILDRATLVPVELVSAMKAAVFALPILFILGAIGNPLGFFSGGFRFMLTGARAIAAAVFAGAVLAPIFLPWLPGRAFTWKGLTTGLIIGIVFLARLVGASEYRPDSLQLGGWFFIICAISACLAMNFTGSSTYTSLSGVRREMRWAVPLEIGAAAIGLLLLILSRIHA